MKKNSIFIFSLLVFTILFQSCNKNKEEQALQSKVEFSFSAGQLKVGGGQGLTSVVISVEDLQGNVVINSEKIDIYNMNDSYISEPVSLVVGNYKLTRFLVLNQNNDVVYAAPLEGSPKASQVQTPLPIEFSTQKDQVNKIIPQVLSCTEDTPEDFGYSTFSFEIADSFDFLLGAFAYDSTSKNFELTDASLYVYSNSELICSAQLRSNKESAIYLYDSLKVTNKVTLPEKYDNYTLVISKSKYTTYSKTFSKEELRKYYRSEDKGPLVVKLNHDCNFPGCDFNCKPSVQYWPSNSFTITNTSTNEADYYFFDFGDSTCSLYSAYVFQVKHTYKKPGTYTISLTISKDGCSSTTQQTAIILPDENNCSTYAGIDQHVYEDHVYMMADALPAGATGQWSIGSGSGTILNPNSPNTEIVNLGQGENCFRWTVNNGNCTAYDYVRVNYSPVVAYAGVDQFINQSQTYLYASALLTGESGQWTLQSGSATIVNPNNPKTQITNLSLGKTILRWTVTSGLSSAFDDVVITYQPITASAGMDQIVCKGSTNMNATAPDQGGSGSWQVISGSGTFVNPFDPKTQVTNIRNGSNIYRWSVTSNSYSAYDDVKILNNEVIANAGTDLTISGSTCTLSAVEPLLGTCSWTCSTPGVSINPIPIINNPFLSNADVSGIPVGTTIFTLTVVNNGCTAQDYMEVTRLSK